MPDHVVPGLTADTTDATPPKPRLLLGGEVETRGTSTPGSGWEEVDGSGRRCECLRSSLPQNRI